MRQRRIVVLALPGAQMLDVSGPLDVFAEANVQSGSAAYELTVLATAPGPLVTSSGVRLLADGIAGEGNEAPADTLLVAGCPHADRMSLDPVLRDWLRAQAPQARRFGSVCSGAFFLAAAGLLDGVRVTTHWAMAETLAARYPAVRLEEDAIYLRDGRVRTAAGVTAGLDLALALVEEDLGREVALRVASQLVMFFKRPGGQLQFSRRGEAAPAGRAALQEVQRWVAVHPALDHSVPALAARLHVSARHFARMFRADVGMTPAAWVEMARVEAARRLLEEGQQTPKQVAAACGFADADVLRRAFLRRVGMSPAEYRRRHGGGSALYAPLAGGAAQSNV